MTFKPVADREHQTCSYEAYLSPAVATPITNDKSSALASALGHRVAKPERATSSCPRLISKEPLGPVVRHGDAMLGRHRALDAVRA